MNEGTTKTPTGSYILETVVEVVSLRDQFAMAALTAVIITEENSDPKTAAKYAYEYADVMLEARKEKK